MHPYLHDLKIVFYIYTKELFVYCLLVINLAVSTI